MRVLSSRRRGFCTTPTAAASISFCSAPSLCSSAWPIATSASASEPSSSALVGGAGGKTAAAVDDHAEEAPRVVDVPVRVELLRPEHPQQHAEAEHVDVAALACAPSRLSAVPARTSSGAMSSGVPTAVVMPERCAMSREIPKSQSFTPLFSVSRTIGRLTTAVTRVVVEGRTWWSVDSESET